MPPPPFFGPLGFSTELLFTIFSVIFCFLIYFRTRESYELTKYKGIKYFRDAFLFFGLSYVLRFLFALMFLSRIAFDFFLPRGMFMLLSILLLGYFSTIGIFYLIFSSVWKRFNDRNMLLFGHSIALLLSLISFVTLSHFILLYLQCILLITAVILRFIIEKKGKKVSHTQILYLLVAVLWLINLLVIDQAGPIPWEIKIIFQIISLIVFIAIYHKVSKWIA